ncbi:MAG: co-chaperone GroES [Microgenomates group bacterium]
MSNIIPVAGHVLVQPTKKEKVTSSGIVLATSHEDKPQQGTVLAIGGAVFSDGREINSPVKVGDVVIYREWGGKEYKDGDNELLILKFDDIMAVINK